MWKRTKNTGASRQSFSLVHQYIQRFNEVSGTKSAVIRRRSKVPGVMITQYVANLPEGKSTPDFQCKPIPLTIQEGKCAVFKAVVTGDPKPDVSWRRAKGTLSDKEKFQSKYDESTDEHILEIRKVTAVEADTYKCYAMNEYGKAVCAATLNVIETLTNPSDFRKLLRSKKESKVEENQAKTADEDVDGRFWDAMLNAERKDYERICAEFGVRDLHMILKKLEEKKKERAQNKYMNGVIPYSEDSREKHCLKSGRSRKDSNIKGLAKDTELNQVKLRDAGLHHSDAEDISLILNEYKLSNVDFVVKIQEVLAQEKGTALFECVLTHPLQRITWMGKGSALEDGEKYSISVSDHKLIHRLLIKDCMELDKGIYSAVAGITSCSARLIVEAESDLSSAGQKKTYKTTLAGGAVTDLEDLAKQQQLKNQEEMEKILAAVKAKHGAGQLTEKNTLSTYREDGEIIAVTGPKNRGADMDMLNTTKAIVTSKTTADSESAENTSSRGGGSDSMFDVSGCVKKSGLQLIGDGPTDKKYTNLGPEDFDKVTDADIVAWQSENEDLTESPNNSKHIKRGQEREHRASESSSRCDDAQFNEIQMFAMRQDQVNDSEGSENPATSAAHPKPTKKTQHKKCASDSNEPAYDSDDSQDSTDRFKESTHSKKSQKPQHAANDPNEPAYDSDDNQDSTDRLKKSTHSKKSQKPQHAANDPNEQAYDSDDEQDSNDQLKKSSHSKKSRKPQDAANGESINPEEHSKANETEDATSTETHSRRKRLNLLVEDLDVDPGVQFVCGLSDVDAVIGETAELTCKLSSEACVGAWFKDGKEIPQDDNFTITKDGAFHKLVIIRCKDEHSGKYRFEADGRKTEAMISVKDPPRFDPEDLEAFSKTVTVKVGCNAIFKLQFVGHKPIKIQWYREGEELQDDNATKIEKSASHSRLLLSRCHRKDTGEIKIKLKNEDGFTEAVSQLIVLDKPTSPLGPTEVTESSPKCIEFRWRPPKDDGGSPVINYILERQQVGRNTWKKIGEIPGVACYRDTEVDHGRKYCYRIRAVTAEGISEAMETEDMQAGRLAFPGPPAPPKVVGAYDDCINLSWVSPSNTGGSHILGYILEKRKKGSNLWTVVNTMGGLIKEKKYAVKDVVTGMEYEFRVTAINLSGAGEFSNPCEFVFARDPKKPPGKVTGLKVTETSYTHFVLTWTKPEEKPDLQDEAKGYFVEIRQVDCLEWSRCNSGAIITTSFSVKGLKPMDLYWVRVIATNDGGESDPAELFHYVTAMPSLVRPKFTNHKMKSFVVVRAGNSVRLTINFEASPQPEITWLKDNVPVTKRVTISNLDGSSQLLIPSSERSDSGIYSILVKNFAGQETFSSEIRVTDDPKPPGLVELEENVPGTVTVSWDPSPDEKRDDRLHYTVSKLDSTKRTWVTVADRLFNNKFTVCNIMQGREYHFRVYAKNDMGISAYSESPTWGMEKKKEKFLVSLPPAKDCDLRCAPTFIVPLKLHTAPKGYECYMSCAVKGNPTPRITWYRNQISINTNTNYYITNTCGVCSMLILHVGPKDMGEYTITAENALGRAECSTVLSVRE